MSRNSSTPSWAFFTPGEVVCTTIPSATGVVHAGGRPRTPSISTRHMRHIPTGFMRGCQQKRGMYTPWRSAAAITSSPGRASKVRPSTVTVTVSVTVVCSLIGSTSSFLGRCPELRHGSCAPRCAAVLAHRKGQPPSLTWVRYSSRNMRIDV